ncbi:MAG: 4Fe-4S binding protein, partial [Candidatus Thorarchaeota archaeon]
MLVNTRACDSSLCNLDCIEACKRVYGDDSPLSFDKDQKFPVINSETCTICLACVRACPMDAITSDQKRRKRSAATTSTSSCDVTDYCPYEVADTFERMSEADTIFARVQYDPEFQYYQKTEFSGAELMISKGVPGYDRFEYELSVAAWKLYDSRQSIIRAGIGLDPEGSEVGDRRITAPIVLTKMVKKAARFFGADLVGIAPLNRDWLYTVNRRGEPYDVPDSMEYVIVMAIEMDYDAIATSPTFTSSAATALGYST